MFYLITNIGNSLLVFILMTLLNYKNTTPLITFVLMSNYYISKLVLTVFGTSISLMCSAQADTMGIDTTGLQYRIGYQIGSWLPFLIIFLLMVIVTVRGIQLSRRKNASLYDK